MALHSSIAAINENDYDGNHPTGGGLYVTPAEDQGMIIAPNPGDPFGVLSRDINERVPWSGLRLTVDAVTAESTPQFFSHDFVFDLDSTT